MRHALPWLVILVAIGAVALLLHDAGWIAGRGVERADGDAGADDGALDDGFTNEIPDLPPMLRGASDARVADATDGAGDPATKDGAGEAKAGAASSEVRVAFGGLVRDPQGRAVAGVAVTARGTDGEVVTAETAESGRFDAKLRPGRYTLLFRSEEGYGALALKEYLVDGAADHDAEFVLRETVRFLIHLLRDRQGVEDAEVTLHPLIGIGGEVARTDALGDAAFEEVVAGSYWMVAALPSGEEIRRKLDLAKDQELRVDVPAGILVFGRVEDATKGGPVPDARIEIGVRGPSGTWIVAESTSGEDGAYEVRIPKGRVRRFYVAADGFAPWPTRRQSRSVLKSLASVNQGRETERAVRLQPGTLVTGVIRDDQNREVEGVTLRFVPRRGPALEATSDEAGVYELLGALTERFDVVVLTEGYFSDKALRVRVPKLPAGESFAYDVKVYPTLDVSGKVAHADGKPAAGTRVWVSARGRLLRAAHHAGRDLETFSDASGWWRLTDLPADTGVVLRAALGALEARPRGIRTSSLPKTPIELKLQPTVTLKGRVIDVGTRMPVPGAKVVIRPRGSPGGRTTRTLKTDADGVYAAFELIPGTWELKPSKGGYLVAQPLEERLDPDDREAEVELRLDPGLVVAGVVTDQAGRVLSGVAIYVQGTKRDGKKVNRSAKSNARGEFRLTGFESGLYRVVARRKGYRNAVVRDLVGGEDRLFVQMRKR